MEDFKVEKIYDKEIINGFLSVWPHHNFRADVIGYVACGNADDKKVALQEAADWLNSED